MDTNSPRPFSFVAFQKATTTFRQTAARDGDYERVGRPVPSLPLVSVGWENERTDLHGLAGTGFYGYEVHVVCVCGETFTATMDTTAHRVLSASAWQHAFDLLVAHAARAAALLPA